MSINQLMADRPELLPALTLAYIGDAFYELQVRKYLLDNGIYKVDELHKRAINLVRAATQASFAQEIEGSLTEFEISVMHRGRNAKGQHTPKGVAVTTYRIATGVEALVGYWHLSQNQERLDWFFDLLWQFAEANSVALTKGEAFDEKFVVRADLTKLALENK